MSGEQSERHVDDARERPSTFNVRTKSKSSQESSQEDYEQEDLRSQQTERATGATSRTYYRTRAKHRSIAPEQKCLIRRSVRTNQMKRARSGLERSLESAIKAGAQPRMCSQDWSAAWMHPRTGEQSGGSIQGRCTT